MTRAELSDGSTGEAAEGEELDLPPRLAGVLDHLEEAAAGHDGEFADVLDLSAPGSRLTRKSRPPGSARCGRRRFSPRLAVTLPLSPTTLSPHLPPAPRLRRAGPAAGRAEGSATTLVAGGRVQLPDPDRAGRDRANPRAPGSGTGQGRHPRGRRPWPAGRTLSPPRRRTRARISAQQVIPPAPRMISRGSDLCRPKASQQVSSPAVSSHVPVAMPVGRAVR